ncbi:MAG: response regulator [Calothrix sp. C42_A2020_038]|nr:response regulator [Calothrix sp. C42_A2020_038]
MNKTTLNQGQLNTINLGRQKFFQPIEHLSFLRKISQDYVNGKLQVFSISQQWSIYFEEGKLVYVCQLNQMWDIFDKQLQQRNPHLKNLDSQVINQLKAIFSSSNDDIGYSSYLAICWLMEQQYLNSLQVKQLIEELAIEVMESFLKLRDGIYELLPNSFLDDLPKFTYIDISTIAKLCQQRSHKAGKFIRSGSSYVFSDSSEPEPVNQNKQLLPNEPDLSNSSQEIYQHNRTTVTSVKQVNNYINPDINTTTKTHIKEVDRIETELKAPVKEVSSKQGQIYKVMCIDDSPTILKAVRGFLDEELFQVVGLTDPLKALMQILRIKPDVILLDISMPNLDGYELCSLIRKHPEFRQTPVIMVTGKTGFIDKARAKLVKASGYLTKPFSQAELIKIVFQQIACLNI